VEMIKLLLYNLVQFGALANSLKLPSCFWRRCQGLLIFW